MVTIRFGIGHGRRRFAVCHGLSKLWWLEFKLLVLVIPGG
jgi:hypothetical protein